MLIRTKMILSLGKCFREDQRGRGEAGGEEGELHEGFKSGPQNTFQGDLTKFKNKLG
jgi:hypothetical protein